MLERKSPLSQKRILGKFGNISEEIGVTIQETKSFSYLELTFWTAASPALSSKLFELLGVNELPIAGKVSRIKEGALMRAAPGRLVYYGDEGTAEILRAMVSDDEGSVVSLSHSRCALSLSGPKVTNLLRRGIRLDLSEAAFPVGACGFTEIHGLGVLLIRNKADQFELIFMRTTALNMWTWLTETAEQFGYEVL
ncbi:MAG: sarcosine oxidase subunit gamma family protein [Sneathiella sp.]|uniref:sarcosine oxidase subunit gamma n=1 Tax=Sneathiella sp. TaxID=1964365 RepID=UPI00300240ED